MSEEAPGGAQPSVRITRDAADAFRALPPEQAPLVAGAMGRIGIDPGEPFRLAEPDEGAPDGTTSGDGEPADLVMVPDGSDAPVVVYHQVPAAEGGGYLVTALADRKTYDAYTAYRQFKKRNFLQSPAGKALVGAASAAAAAIMGIALGSHSGRGTFSG